MLEWGRFEERVNSTAKRTSPVTSEWEAQGSQLLGRVYEMPVEHKGALRAWYKRAGVSAEDACAMIAWAFTGELVDTSTWPGRLDWLLEQERAYRMEVTYVGADICALLRQADSAEARGRREVRGPDRQVSGL